jgi:hypothetical protein
VLLLEFLEQYWIDGKPPFFGGETWKLNTDLSAFLALILSLSSFSTNKWKFMTHK